jgi:hypothetical protein
MTSGRQVSHLSLEMKLDSFSLTLRNKQFLGLLSVDKRVVFLQFLSKSSTAIFRCLCSSSLLTSLNVSIYLSESKVELSPCRV